MDKLHGLKRSLFYYTLLIVSGIMKAFCILGNDCFLYMVVVRSHHFKCPINDFMCLIID